MSLSKTLARTALAVIATGSVAIIALWITTPLWIPTLLRPALMQRGWQLDALMLQRPSWRTLTIEQLALTQMVPANPAGNAAGTQIDARQIVLHYQPRDLLRGHLERVDIAELRATWQPSPSATTGSEPPALAKLLPGEWLPLLPVGVARIDSIELRTPWPQLAVLRGELDYRDRQISLQLRNATPPAGTIAYPLSIALQADADNQIQLILRDSERAIATIDNRFTRAAATADAPAHTAIAGQISIDLDALQPFIPRDTAQLSGRLDANWQGRLPETIDERWPQQLQLEGGIRSDGTIATPTLPRVQTGFASQFQWRDGLLAGSIEKGVFNLQWPMPNAIAKRYAITSKQMLAIDAVIGTATRYRLDVAQRVIELKPVRIDARIRNKAAGIDSTLIVDEFSAQYGDQPRARAHLAVTTPALPLSTMRLQPAQLTTSLQFADDKLTGRWQLRDLAKIYRADGTFTHRLPTGDGELSARLQPLTFRENGNYLPAIVAGWPWPLDFSSGELSATGALRWSAAGTRANGTLIATKLGGFYNHNLFRGVDSTATIDYRSDASRDSLRITAPAVAIADVQAGLPVRNIRISALQFDGSAIQGQNLRAELFGGEITQAQLHYDLKAKQNAFALQATGLQLEKMLELQSGVEGSGTIDGTLPLLLHDNGLRVDGAQFQARAPGGVLRYQGDTPAGAAQNPGLALAFKALENFHYDSMSVKANFSLGEPYGDQSGDMLLAVALKGRNPAARDTPPVNFNLNIRENIPDLIRTLQIGDDISDRIEQRIKKLQQPPRADQKTRAKNEKGAAP